MKRSLFILLTILMAAFGAKADITADWKMHMPFDAWPVSIVETPSRVYFMSRTFEKNTSIPERSIPSHSLFYYDKAGDEILSVNERVEGSGNAVASIAYNAAKKYLLVVYTDCNIDFIYDDGRIFNVPALQITSIPGKKEAASITFDSARNRAYVATTFGYVALNDDRHEVAESRNYGVPLQSIARVGDNIVAVSDGAVYYAPASSQRFNFSDYTLIGGTPELDTLLPLDGGSFMAYRTGTGQVSLVKFTPADKGYTWEIRREDSALLCHQEIPAGYRLAGKSLVYEIQSNGNISSISRPSDVREAPSTSYDGKELWSLVSRKGVRSYKINGESDFTLTRDFMRPNAPAVYISTAMAYHPTYGLIAGSNAYDMALDRNGQVTPSNLSAIKDGFWKEYGLYYTNPGRIRNNDNFGGVAIDPNNPDYVYRASTLRGMLRMNLKDPDDVLILANPSNTNSSSKGFIKIVEDMSAWNVLCRFTVPQFDTYGTMWSLFYNRNHERAELWYWPAADRAATTSAESYRPMKQIVVPRLTPSNYDMMITLKRMPNVIAIGGFSDSGTVMLYDHNGTPDNTGDDRIAHIINPYDQDGGGVEFLSINNLWEDPESGMLFIMSQRGLFTVNPATAFENPNQVNRIKVARNDGTNLADYLLNEVNVNSMTADGEGRKWFATSNGIVCTSKDGRSILGEFTTANSYLPAENVYDICYNPDNNSLMVASEGGLVEMFPSGSGSSSGSDTSGMRVYPNPVEPDYYGWVRIDNIADGSLVKITDAKGGIVKELGPAQGGSVEWDVSGYNNRRVSTGVYYVMVSPGSSGDGNTQISKILVLN